METEEPTMPIEEEFVQNAPEEDFRDKYLRSLAEMENLRRRTQKDKQDMLRFGIDNALADFLPSIDQLENALRFASEATEEVKNWAMGFQMILAQLQNALQAQGITSYTSEGTLFDPNLHEVTEAVETENHPDGMILQEFSKGYKSATRVVRPARVKVAKQKQQTI